MHPFLAVFMGIVFALAAKTNNGTDNLRWWRWLAGGLAALLPSSHILFYFVGYDFYLNQQYGLTWSLFFLVPATFMACVLIGQLWRKSWQKSLPWSPFFSSISAAVAGTVLFAVFTDVGIRPFWPLSSLPVALWWLHPFDLSLLAIAVLTLGVCLALPGYNRDIARLGVVLMLVYVAVIATFALKAEGFGRTYAKALGLENARIYAIPQPISPLNWRIMVLEENGTTVHDTLVDLFTKDEVAIDDTSTRAARMDALYKPMDKAVWRIYERFGYGSAEQRERLREIWEHYGDDNARFDWLARFTIFRGTEQRGTMDCLKFQDIRTIGAKHDRAGRFYFCNHQTLGWRIYR